MAGSYQYRLIPTSKPQLIGIFRSWVETVIWSPSSERYHLTEIAHAIGRFGFRELVPELKRLLDEDLARLKKVLKYRERKAKRCWQSLRATTQTSRATLSG